MSSKREQILQEIYTNLKTLETNSIKVYRNLDKPQKVDGGIINLHDGEAGEPEILLSPLTYIYEHLVTLEVMVQDSNSAVRDTNLDNLLIKIGGIINSDRTFGGLVEWLEARAPSFNEEPIEGAATIRAATVQIMVRFFTTDPLN